MLGTRTGETGRGPDVELSKMAARLRIPPTIFENGADAAVSKEVHRGQPARIDPALKSWLDNVIIPSLVRRFLSEREASERIPLTQGTDT